MDPFVFAGNVALAALLGTIIGVERELNQHPAGLRTNALVAVGAALFVSVTALLGDTNSPSRVASYIVSGVGFLGGGAILKEGATVRGLTTAAGLWCSAAVGTICGIGHPGHAALGTMFVVGVLLVMKPLSFLVERVGRRSNTTPGNYTVNVVCREPDHAAVSALLTDKFGHAPALVVTGAATRKHKHRQLVLLTFDVTATPADDEAVKGAIARLLAESCVRSATWERVAPAPG